MKLINSTRRLVSSLFRLSEMQLATKSELHAELELQKMMIGRLMSETFKKKKNISNLGEVEFKIFSQFGDDGIIQWLIENLEIEHKTFIEFGVANYQESNTRFLLMNNNWSGFVLDGSTENIRQITESDYYWQHQLTAKAEFIDCENINILLLSSGFYPEIGILHIDVDGNDYWILKAINVVNPVLLILEYNAVFGNERAITVPYDDKFYRTQKHASNLYFGASLPALTYLSNKKGYSFVGCNRAGNNAYFVRNDKLNEQVKEVSLEAGFVPSKFREARDTAGKLTHLGGADRLDAIKGMTVVNVYTNEMETL